VTSLMGRLALAGTSVALTLVAVEVGLRWLRPIPFSIERNMYYEPDPYTGYRIKPYSKGQFAGGIPAVANRHGHRSDEIAVVKGPGVFRILVLGDSFTMGASVEQAETYASVLQRLLNADAKLRYEVINAGVGGWSPLQYAQYYEHYGPELEPDLVLVGFFVGNDLKPQRPGELGTAVLGRRVTREAAASPFVAMRVALHENSHLARLLVGAAREPPSYGRRNCEDFSGFFLRIQRGRREIHRVQSDRRDAQVVAASRQLARIRKLTQQAGIPLLVLLLPDENQINPALQKLVFRDPENYDLTLPQTLLVSRFSLAGIDFVDLLPAFRADARCLFQNDTHWTAEGQALVAREAFRALVSQRLLAGPSPVR
jgi:hypothetical protein